jgi:hypothetical protein
MIRTSVAGLVGPALVAALFAATARADGPPAAAPKPPKYENLRFREDWSAFRATCPAERCDATDRWKALCVGGEVTVDVGGQLRGRYESWDEQTFGAVPGDDGWGLLRARLHVNVRAGGHVRLFAEGIYADADGRDAGPRPVDENHGDLQNLFLEAQGVLGDADVGGWVGRHELLFGKQRLVGPVDWTNVRRTFDGVGAWVKGCNWKADAFFVRPVIVEADEGDEADDDVEFAGVHYVNTATKDRTWEAYVYYLHRDEGVWAKVADEETRVTVGGLCAGPICGTCLDYDAEVAWQAGTWGDADISAFMATVEVGWKPGGCWQPRIALGADYASGDDGVGGDLGTFHQLFPTGHLWFGWADLIGRQNVMAARLTATAKPTEKLTVRLDAHQFRRADTDDAVYNAGGGVLRAAGASDERAVATEFDLQAKLAVDRHLDVEVGASYVVAGKFLEETGADEDVTFFYLMVTFTF